MTEITKADLCSWLRAGVHILATLWGANHPDISGALEAAVPIVAMLIWTKIDNSKRSGQQAPSVSITNTLGLLAILAFLATGCASTPQERIVRFAAVAKSVSFEGSIFWLQENPQHKAVLQAVVKELDIAVAGQQFTTARLVAVLKPLNIRELSGKEGRIAIASTIVVWDSLRLAGVIGDTSNLQPVFEGLRDGFKAALEAKN